MTDYIVTGGTGFLGRNVIPLLLRADPTADVHVLVRQASVGKLNELAQGWAGADRVHALVGDLTEPGLGLDATPIHADHIVHLGAVYDLTAGEEQSATNVEGTRAVIDLALQTDATLHHVSSVAVSGDYDGTFSEADFDRGQSFPTPYHRTKFEAEKLVREADGLRWRVYRPGVVVGHSVTGEINKIDGPYYFFPAFAALGKLPSALPAVIPNLGATNIVPVDFVAAAMAELIARPGLDGQVFHLVNPKPQPISEVYRAFAVPAGAPRYVTGLPAGFLKPVMGPPSNPSAEAARTKFLARMGIPASVVDSGTLPTVFTTAQTDRALAGTGIRVPDLADYGPTLFRYWAENLDPLRARRSHPDGPLVGRHVVITGASSGIGRAAAAAVADKGATVFLLARRTDELASAVDEIRQAGGHAFAYQCDVTESESVDQAVKDILEQHGHIDMLVNNAGRSIRRSVYRSTDRLHDYERTMAVNYFGAVRMVLALLPHMKERKFGHVVNISSTGVQASSPRFSAYLGSKAALDKFTDVVSTETASDGITFTTIHMPLVDTPMIAPTGKNLSATPVATPEWAAATIVRALVERPKRIDTPVGTMTEYWALVAPRLKDRFFHQYYLRYPDSPAAKGQSSHLDEGPDTTSLPIERPKAQRRPPRVVRQAGKAARRASRWVPGTQW